MSHYGIRPGAQMTGTDLLRRLNDMLERVARGEPVRPNEERVLRMDVREHLGITGEGEPWFRS